MSNGTAITEPTNEPAAPATPAAEPANPSATTTEPNGPKQPAADPAKPIDPAKPPETPAADPAAAKPGEPDKPTDSSKPDGEGKPESGTGAPEKYETFQVAEGVKLDDGQVEAASAVFKDLNLTQEQAQKLVDFQATQMQSQAEAWSKQVKDWGDEIKADPEVGGEAYDANAGKARSLIKRFGSEELSSYLNETGLGNHPHLFKFVLKLAQGIGEDATPPGTTKAPTPADSEAALHRELYPTMHQDK